MLFGDLAMACCGPNTVSDVKLAVTRIMVKNTMIPIEFIPNSHLDKSNKHFDRKQICDRSIQEKDFGKIQKDRI